MDCIKDNIEDVLENIAKAADKVGRQKEDITLIAVSKTKPVQDIEAALACHVTDMGENKVQEIRQKYEVLGHNATWHMIGHLQTNKVKYIIDKVDLIHSVDSIKLAEKINVEAKKADKIIDILIQLNVADEETKFGIKTMELDDFIRQVSNMSQLRIRGLMTIAPYVEDPEENREIFREISQLAVDIKRKNIDNVNMDILSMGMTNDYMVAIEEGSTMVRVGTGIFGKRDYNKR
ncbi:YggS family pyridoxal phosphate-dependent enzyme [Vallitalea pronyensis]|uniref:Pyridoxal phosphate homeostasis protein n=1 Tax=Vallitalea pronyensis TaxID=1348613 RepID=A0A8J8ML14_9FIRM|nr:YggS family pyridoxal phosphate-dependent enzyme [Vallitalea pronyensis]QUI23362.1 YggS family pyridoxal phosphate-dependent enzyme [Vallitalea pronyensis]